MITNTFGMYSINNASFSFYYEDALEMEKAKYRLLTALRIHNCLLNVFGYLPFISSYSGQVRVFTGALLLAFTYLEGNPKANSLRIIDQCYEEAINTGIFQIGRGMLEISNPYGQIFNLAFDCMATIYNQSYTDQNIAYPYPFGCLKYI